MVGLPHCSAETLSALLDGELTVDERARARDHLDSCLECGARLVAARRLDTDLRDPGRLSCASIRPSLSAIADGEAPALDRTLTVAHLAECPECRLASAGLRDADRLLATLPPAAPSARVDAFIAQLAHPRPGTAFRPVTFAFRAAGALALAVLIAIGSTLFPAGVPSADRTQSAEVAMVAAIQRVVFDGRTNTLYLLDTERAEVSAVDATTQGERARVSVGGRPTALALSTSTNRVLVLDATSKRLTEIDTLSHLVVATSTLVVTGTPTSLQVDPTTGRIVVASVSAPATNAAPAASAALATGHVTVIDPVSKQVETVTAVDVAPQLVVLDAKGAQALLLSARETTLVDAASYKSIDQLPGGVAAAFDVSGAHIAVLSADGDGSKVTFRGAGLPGSLALSGRPIALISMPAGGFAALVERDAKGEVDVIDATGHLVSSSAVALAGHSVTYDPLTARFAVGGDVGTALAFTGASPVAASAPATNSPPPAAAATNPPPSSPSPSTAPVVPSAGPSAPSIARPQGLPAGAQLAWTGTYRLGLTGNRRPTLLAGAGGELWFVDQAKRLATVDTVTGSVTDVAQLPLDGSYTHLFVGATHVLAIDTGKGRILTYTIAQDRMDTVAFPFVSVAQGFALGQDDSLWLAGGESSIALAIDAGTNKVTAVDLKASLITALYVDTAGRVWFADGASGGLGYYDRGRRTVVGVPIPSHAAVTALAMDRDGTLWVGTVAGELLSVRLGIAGPAGSAGGSVAGLVRDASGNVWSYVSAAGAFAYRQLPGTGGVRLAATQAVSMAFDGHGRAWLGDPVAAAFYIALNGGE